MANPNFRQDGDKNVLNTVVLWCCCGFFFIICGYGLYRQHTLEQRVLMLEQHFQELRRAAQVEQPALGAGPELSRKERDVGDCICPAGVETISSKYEINESSEVTRRIKGTKPISHMFFIYGVKIEGQSEGPRIYGPIKQGSSHKRLPATIDQLHESNLVSHIDESVLL
ncbi:unnamed protein product [Spodoptera exigua]|nr:unnamed protein product [Spodoptera exigua]